MLIQLLFTDRRNKHTRQDWRHWGRTVEIKTTLISVLGVNRRCCLVLRVSFHLPIHVTVSRLLFQHSRLTSTNSLSGHDSNIIPKNQMGAQLLHDLRKLLTGNRFILAWRSSLWKLRLLFPFFISSGSSFVNYVSPHLKSSPDCKDIAKFPFRGTSLNISFSFFPHSCVVEFVHDYVSSHLKPSLSCEDISKFPV